MALTIGQAITISYPAVIAEKKLPENQWEESAFLREMKKLGALVTMSFGPTLELPLDYTRNPTAGVISDYGATSLAKTDFMTSASFVPAEIVINVNWSKRDEATNPTENQKIDFAAARLKNAMKTHDDLIEQIFFSTTTNGFLGLKTHITAAGTGSDGGIDGGTYAFWRSQQATYLDDTNIESTFTYVNNACAKGSGSSLEPSWMTSGATPHAIFEGTQQAMQRWVDTQNFKAGAKTLGFKNARYTFSPFGDDNVYFGNADSFQLRVSKEYWMEKGAIQEIQGRSGFTMSITSFAQTVTGNRSRLGVAHL